MDYEYIGDVLIISALTVLMFVVPLCAYIKVLIDRRKNKDT